MQGLGVADVLCREWNFRRRRRARKEASVGIGILGGK
jgi:hypothetical protein